MNESKIKRFFLITMVMFLVVSLLAFGQLNETATAQVLGFDILYTTDADFNQGTLVSVNHDAPLNDQLQLDSITKPFPFINVAASGRGTVVRANTETGEIIGEYRTAPEGRGLNPSRTTVDLFGNVWTANRNEVGEIDGVLHGAVVKIGLIVGGTRVDSSGSPDSAGGYLAPPFGYSTCIDRNGDNLIRTSQGLGNILTWPDITDGIGGADGLVDDADDECILIYQRLPDAEQARHVSVDADNNVWVGGYPFEQRRFYKLDGATGAILDSFDSRNIGCGGYGGLIDGNGILWSVGGPLLRYDPATKSGSCIHEYGYGLGIDTNGYIWMSLWDGGIVKIAPDGTIVPGFPKPTYPPSMMTTSLTASGASLRMAPLLQGQAAASITPLTEDASVTFQVAPVYDWVESSSPWTPGATISLTIEDGSGVVYSDSQTADGGGYFNFNLWDVFDLQRGHVVTVSDGANTKTHTVIDLFVDGVDVTADTVFGRTDAGADVDVWVHGDGSLTVTADGSGNWTADFSGMADLTYLSDGGSQQIDPDGDSTGVWWASPRFQVAPDDNWVGSWSSWMPGATISLTIEDGGGVLFADSQTADTNGNFNFNVWEPDLVSGHVVTVSAGTTTKTHTVTDIEVTSIDTDADQIHGTAGPGARVEAWASLFDEGSGRYVTADSGGNWLADFSVATEDQPVFDITDITRITAREFDDDGDLTSREFGPPFQQNRGVAVTPIDNHVWVANSGVGTATRLDNDGNIVKVIDTGNEPTGVAVDAAGKVWATNMGSHNAVRIDPSAGGDGLGAVDLTVDLGPDAWPYNYSDMTGAVVVGSTSPQGLWTVVQDSGTPGFEWGRITWNTEPEGNVPAGTDITVEARAADTEAGLGGQPFQAILSGDLFSMFGRHIEVRVILKAGSESVSPVLSDIRIQSHVMPAVNDAPVADANGPYTANEGSLITLDASASSDLDGSIVLYEWDLDNDGEYDDATGVTAGVVFDDNGAFTVGLRVTDDFGATDTTTAPIEVSNVPPTVGHVSVLNATEGNSVSMILLYPEDPSPVDTASGFEFAFDCGDGYGVFGTSNSVACPTTDNGIRTIKGKIKDKDEGETEYIRDAFVSNVAPTASLGAIFSTEGNNINLYLAGVFDPSPIDTAAGFEYAFDCGDGSGYGGFSDINTAVCSTTDNGTRTVGGKIRDKDDGESEYTRLVTVNNVAPTATFNAPAEVDEGEDINLSLTGPFDPSSDDTAAGFEYTFDCGDGAGYVDWSNSSSAQCPTTDEGTRTVKGKIRDKDGGETDYATSIDIYNVAPTIDAVIAPLDPVAIGDQPVSVEIVFSDPGIADTHDVTWDWGDTHSNTQHIASSPATQSHTFEAAGVYTVVVTVVDDDGGLDTEIYEYIVIYDPSAGFVTGGGWIDSPVGAYVPDPTLVGKATFGFVSKYKKGTNIPTGETEFQFKVADLNFHSEAYQWMVIAGPNAKFKGVGSINGESGYGFMLTAGDGDLVGGGNVDTFRIKVWDLETESVIYDNKLGEPDDSTAGTALGGGSIKIHKGK